jgi:transposase
MTTDDSSANGYLARLRGQQRDQTILTLHQQEHSIREIAHLLKVSRNTVRRIIRNPPQFYEEVDKEGGAEHASLEEKSPNHPIGEHLSDLYITAKGNGVRIMELAQELHGIEISYSTLTRLIRQTQLRQPTPKRSGRYHFEAGAEMQHDTSPHTIEINGKKVIAQCAAAILPVSRYAFIQYYPCFTRFEIQVFLTEAIQYFGGSTPRCTIDNTSVVVASGSGPEAVIAPQMRAFGEYFGMTFIPHAVMHSDRKAHVERIFSWVEGNFIPGRSFDSWSDLNTQARAWSDGVANQKVKQAIRMSPKAAFDEERKTLLSLPPYIPVVTRIEQRVVDSYGFTHLETNRYSVPQRLIGKSVELHKRATEVVIHFQSKVVANHQRLIGERDGRSTIKGHHTNPRKRYKDKKAPSTEESLLRGHNKTLDHYLDQLKQHLRGRGIQGMRRLLQMRRTYPAEPFQAAIDQADHYGLYDLQRLEQMILERVRGNFFQMDDLEC